MKFSLKSALLASTIVVVPNSAWAQDQESNTQFNRDDIEEVVVQGQFIPDEKRATSEVANVLDSESFQRAGDGDVAVALTRVTGLSLFQGKFVFVRGLGERYSSVLMENALFPSTDPLRRVVALDILPTSLVENVLVQKTYSAAFPAEFGGGVVNIRTKAVPDEFVLDVSASAGFNTVSTFATGFTAANRGSSEWTSFRSDVREIPQGLLDVPFGGVVPEATTESLGQLFSVDEEPNHPNGNFSVTFGNGWDVGDRRIGVLLSGGWNTEIVNKNGIRRVIQIEGTDPNQDFSPEACLASQPGLDPSIAENCGRRNTEERFSLNALASFGLEWDANNAFKWTTTLLRNSVSESLIQQGIFDADPDNIRTFVRNDFIETNLITSQLSGDHQWSVFGDSDTFQDTIVQWRATYANTDRDAPNRQEVNFQYFPSQSEFRLLPAQNLNETSFSALDDESIEVGFDVTQPMTVGDVLLDVKFGANYADRERSSATRRFIYQGLIGQSPDVLRQVPELIFSPQNIGNGIQLRDSTAGSDAFEASIESYAFYGQVDAQVTPRLRVSAGLRYEDSEQTSDTAEFIIGLGDPEPISFVQNVDRLLPSATITYEVVENLQARVGFSQTLSRPDLRELSNALFIDPDRDTLVIGNPGTLVDTNGDGINDDVVDALQPSIFDNYDFRLEWYYGLGEQASIGVFYKEIQDPIEQSFGFRAGTLLQSFDNADSAELFGIEAEIEKILDVQDWFGWDWMGDRIVLLKLNGTWVDAEVSFDENFGDVRPTNLTRRLQGQSEWLANVQLGWESVELGETFNIALNYTGDRIFTVGVNGAPDVFEEPPILVNINYKRRLWENVEMSLGIDNILGDEYILRAGDVLAEEYDIGRTFTIGVKYSF